MSNGTVSVHRGLHLPVALPPRVHRLVQSYGLAAPVVVLQTLAMAPTVVLLAPYSLSAQEYLQRAWCRRVLFWTGVDLTVVGADRVNPAARYVFVSNHQSHMDVPCLIVGVPNRMRFIAKRSLLKIPLFGQALKAVGTVDIDRSDRADTLRKLREAQQGVGQRFSLHFFAEGTRSEDGRLRPFKKGAAAMALALQVPLVPVAICGTRRVFPKGAAAALPGPVTLEIGAPIPVGRQDTADERHRLLELARDQVARMLAAHGEPAVGPEGDASEVSSHGG